MSVQAVFEKLRSALEAARIPYFVTGSFASSAHGVPRATNDIDIVISPTREQLEASLERAEKKYRPIGVPKKENEKKETA